MPSNHSIAMKVQQHPHVARLMERIHDVEERLDDLTKHTVVWDDDIRQLKKLKLKLRDELEAWQAQGH